jgi:hypothetical protein
MVSSLFSILSPRSTFWFDISVHCAIIDLCLEKAPEKDLFLGTVKLPLPVTCLVLGLKKD